MKSFIAIALVVLVAFAAAQDATKDKEAHKDMKEDMTHSQEVKNVDLTKLVGPWYEIAATGALIKSFLKGCTCNQLTFHKLEANRLLGVSSCKNMTTGELKSVNGTLTQVKPNSNVFRIDFIETDVQAVKKQDINQTAAQEVKPIKEQIVKGEDAKKPEADKSKEAEKLKEDSADKKIDPNAYIVKLDENYKHLILATPDIKGAWILSKDKQMDENVFKQYSDFLSKDKYGQLQKIDHSKC
jgi:lipocalin